MKNNSRIWSQELYIKAWRFACAAHLGQKLPGSDLPYVNHVGNVAMEVIAALAAEDIPRDQDLAVACALLHDTLEDTDTTFETLDAAFGEAVALGVQALSKDKSIGGKDERMRDSLKRIREQPKEVWMVKLADRITNLQPPPAHWTPEKVRKYREEAILIHDQLHAASPYLAGRLRDKIGCYTD